MVHLCDDLNTGEKHRDARNEVSEEAPNKKNICCTFCDSIFQLGSHDKWNICQECEL